MIGPRKVDKPLVLYGYGKLGHLAEDIFKELGIRVEAVFEEKGMVKGILLPDKVMQGNFMLAVCVASEPYNQVIAPLVAAGWTDIIPVWEIVSAYPEVGIDNGWTAPWKETSFAEEDECDTVMSKFCDKLSKVHYERNHWGWRRIHHEQPIEITPIPPLPSTLADIRERQYPIHFSEDYLHEFGKADIHCEGHELKTIEDNIFRFQKYRPRLSAACYHSRDGLYKIEKFLMDNLPDYTWTFRLTAYMGQGAYIYGKPNERRER